MSAKLDQDVVWKVNKFLPFKKRRILFETFIEPII